MFGTRLPGWVPVIALGMLLSGLLLFGLLLLFTADARPAATEDWVQSLGPAEVFETECAPGGFICEVRLTFSASPCEVFATASDIAMTRSVFVGTDCPFEEGSVDSWSLQIGDDETWRIRPIESGTFLVLLTIS